LACSRIGLQSHLPFWQDDIVDHDEALSLQVADLMVRLARRCPHLEVDVLDAARFWPNSMEALTGSETE
jgi:hypothetical protein